MAKGQSGAADGIGVGAEEASDLGPSGVQLAITRGPAPGAEDVGAKLEAIEEGSAVQLEYTHPQLGRTKYEGTLAEKYVGASHLQSYVELTDSQRIGKRGQLRER